MWKLSKVDHKVYSRNPLRTVVFAIEFEPILRITEGSGVAEFQDRIRDVFPKYRTGQSLEVKLDSVGQVDAQTETSYEFLTSDELTKVFLSRGRLAREAKTHLSKESLLSDVDRIVDALKATYSSIQIRRLGLRYINLLDKEQISKDLGKDVGWQDLVSDQFIKLPESLVDIEDAQFANELHASMARGSMSLRYGLKQHPQTHYKQWHIDIDRYCNNPVETESIKELVDGFSSDIYCLFMSAVGSELENWMSIG